MNIEQATTNYGEFFTELTDDRVEDFRAIATPSVRYRDPLMDKRGVDQVVAAMHGWFLSLEEVRFNFTSSAFSERQAFFHWFMHFRIKKMPRRQWMIDGTSRVVFDTTGKVREVQDYWDSAPLLEGFPLLGHVVGAIRKFM